MHGSAAMRAAYQFDALYPVSRKRVCSRRRKESSWLSGVSDITRILNATGHREAKAADDRFPSFTTNCANYPCLAQEQPGPNPPAHPYALGANSVRSYLFIAARPLQIILFVFGMRADGLIFLPSANARAPKTKGNPTSIYPNFLRKFATVAKIASKT